MGLLEKLGIGGGKQDESIKRCQECGKVLPEHTDWCPEQREEPEPRAVESPVPEEKQSRPSA